MTRNEAITFFESLIPGNAIAAEAIRMAIEGLKEQQPKKGEWLKDYTYRKDHPRNYCSVCNMTGGFRTDYCPNCGAYMRKDGEQE